MVKQKIALLFFCIHVSINAAYAAGSCFIAQENGLVIKEEGNCTTPYAPESTFKIVLSLMGFDSGILENGSKPSWSLPERTDPYINVCKGNHNPRTWMRDSCLWYSRILTTKLGIKKFEDYIKTFSYGNMDLAGGITNAWISSTLQISPEGQTAFLQQLVDKKWHLSQEAYHKTKEIMFIQELPGGWNLYGKTGNGKQIDPAGHKTDLQHGWFVGYIEKGYRRIVFANHLVDTEKQRIFASFRARNEAINKLWYLIHDLENE